MDEVEMRAVQKQIREIEKERLRLANKRDELKKIHRRRKTGKNQGTKKPGN